MFSTFFWRPIIFVLLILVILFLYVCTLSCEKQNVGKFTGWNNSTNHEPNDRYPIDGVPGDQDTLIFKVLLVAFKLLFEFRSATVYHGRNASVIEYNEHFIYGVSGGQENWLAEGVFDKELLSTLWVKAHVEYTQKEPRGNRPSFEAIGSFEKQNIDFKTTFNTESQKQRIENQNLDHREIYKRGHLIPCGLQSNESSRKATFTFHNVAPIRESTNNTMSLVEKYEQKNLQSSKRMILIVCPQGQVHSFSKFNNTLLPVYIAADQRNNIDENGNYNCIEKIPVPEIFIKIMIDPAKKKALAFLIPNSPTALDNIKGPRYKINFQSEGLQPMKGAELNPLYKKIMKREVLVFCAYDFLLLFPQASYTQMILDELKKYKIDRLKNKEPLSESDIIDSSGSISAAELGERKDKILTYDYIVRVLCGLETPDYYPFRVFLERIMSSV